jgi:hypothetical protein|tara:strand:+ start:183 stop:380 length:198 start_codon:yes stop_codon:yes gene_type:complete
MKQYEVRFIIPEDREEDIDNPLVNLKRPSLVYLQREYAIRTMASLLSINIPAWIVESEFDDDIPF